MDKPSVLLQLKRITEQNLPIKGTYVKTLKQEDIFDTPINKTTELHSVKVGNQQILVPIVKEEELTQGAISDDLVMKLLSKIKDKKSRQVLSAYIEQEEDINIKKPIVIAKEKSDKEGEETDETLLLKERKDEILKTARQFKTVKEFVDYLETEKIEDFKKELKDNKLTVTLSALTRSLNAIKKRLETSGYIEMKKAEEEEAKRKVKEAEEEEKRKLKQEQQSFRLEKQKEKLAEQQRKKEEQERKQKEREEEQQRKKAEKELKAKAKTESEPKEKKKKVAQLSLEETIEEIEREKEALEKPKKKKKKQKSKKGVSQMTREEVAQEIKLEKTKVMNKKEVEEALEAATKKPEPEPALTDIQVKELKDAFIKDIKTIVKEQPIRNSKVLKALLKEKGFEELKKKIIDAGFKSTATGFTKSINAIINNMPN